MNINDPTHEAMIITGSISSIMCCIGIFILLYSSLLRKQSYNQIILYITISDLITSIGVSFGLCKDRSILCWIQTILTGIGPLCSISWATILLIIVYQNLHKSFYRNNHISIQTHLVCWLFPIILTLLPLTTNRFGCVDEEYCWCFLADRKNSPSWTQLFWIYACFYFWVWAALIGYLVCFLYLLCQSRSDFNNQLHYFILRKLIGYPIIIFLCWSVTSVRDISFYIDPNNQIINSQPFSLLFNTLPGVQGTLTVSLFLISYFRSTFSKQLKENQLKPISFVTKVVPVQHNNNNENSVISQRSYVPVTTATHFNQITVRRAAEEITVHNEQSETNNHVSNVK